MISLFLCCKRICFLQSMVEPLATADLSSSYTNYSRSISFDVINEKGEIVSFQNENKEPIELIIPRDPQLPIPPMFRQNSSTINENLNQSDFYYSKIDFQRTSALSISFHLQLRPTRPNISYLLIYKLLHRSVSLLDDPDGWTLLCSYSSSTSSLVDRDRKNRFGF